MFGVEAVLGVQLDGGIDDGCDQFPHRKAELVHRALDVVTEDQFLDGGMTKCCRYLIWNNFDLRIEL